MQPIRNILTRLRPAGLPAFDPEPELPPDPGCAPWCRSGNGCRRVPAPLHVLETDRTASIVETMRAVSYDYCPCLRGAAARSRHAEAMAVLETEMARREAERLWAATEIPTKLRRYSLNSYLALPDAKPELVARLRRWQEAARRNGRWLLLHGGPGTRKTGLSVSLLREWLDERRSGLYVVAPRFLARIRQTYRHGTGEGAPTADEVDLIAAAAGVDLLVIDDIGAAELTAWGREKLFTVLNERDAWERATIVTTNLTMAELEQHLGERTFDRIRGNCAIAGEESFAIRLAGASRRGMAVGGAP